MSDSEFLESVDKLDRDIIEAIRDGRMKLEGRDIRYLIDFYYQLQEYRKSAKNIERANEAANEPSLLISHLANQQKKLETQVKSAFTAWSSIQPGCQWALSVFGIGPVISSGLAAMVDLSKTTSIGKLWRFAGVDPTCIWEKGKKRPFSAKLKVLTWKIGDSFRKFSGNANCYYGEVYKTRKKQEVRLNEEFRFKDQAEKALSSGHWKKTTNAYKAYMEGKLPDGQIDARAMRYAAKLFLAHWWEQEYRRINKKAPPLPYPIAILGHSNYIPPPGGQIAVC